MTFERITTDPQVRGGLPCIRGLRRATRPTPYQAVDSAGHLGHALQAGVGSGWALSSFSSLGRRVSILRGAVLPASNGTDLGSTR